MRAIDQLDHSRRPGPAGSRLQNSTPKPIPNSDRLDKCGDAEEVYQHQNPHMGLTSRSGPYYVATILAG
jgi:hypothetical protein